MALTSIDIERYIKIASGIKSLPKRDFYLSFDVEADVVYINFHNPALAAEDSELTDDDVIVRYDEQQEIIGLTILHASSRVMKGDQGRQATTKKGPPARAFAAKSAYFKLRSNGRRSTLK